MSMPGAVLVRPRAALIGACLAGLALALAGCSNATNSPVTVTGKTLTIYTSQPPDGAGGATATDVLHAEQLALQQAGSRAGTFTIRLDRVADHETSADARAAIENQSAVAYLGEVVPGTSGVSVQITNEVGLLQVSPTDTAGYLTQADPTVSGSPSTFYPSRSTYHETFARVVPTTVQEAKAIISEMASLHLSKVYVASDGGQYGTSIAAQVRKDATGGAMSVVSTPADADAVFYGGNDVATAARAVSAAASASPSAKLFVPSGLYADAFVSALSPAARQNLYVSSPGIPSGSLSPAARQFQTAFRSAYGHTPVPQAIFGYEAMSAVLAVLKEAGTKAGNRATVVSDFRSLTNRQSVLGTYSIKGGDTTLDSFVFARVHGGSLVPSGQG
jgi:branched-chain amino acid transport system substrate-binding protein